MFRAFFEGKEATFDHIANWALREITPFSVSHPAIKELPVGHRAPRVNCWPV